MTAGFGSHIRQTELNDAAPHALRPVVALRREYTLDQNLLYLVTVQFRRPCAAMEPAPVPHDLFRASSAKQPSPS